MKIKKPFKLCLLFTILSVNFYACAEDGVKERSLANGLYEMSLSPDGHSLYVASSDSFKDVQGGAIYKLDSENLNTISMSHTDLKNFGMAISEDGKYIYVTNTTDNGITSFDTQTGKVQKRIIFKDRNKKGRPYSPHNILLNNGLLYVSGVSDSSLIWVVDASTLQIKKIINNTGKWNTGLFYSKITNRIYSTNGDGEILVINPEKQKIENRWKPLGDKKAFYMNLAEDKERGRLFVTDNSEAKTFLVLDIHTGELIKNIDIGSSFDVKVNSTHNAIYITQRDSGKLISLNKNDYNIIRTWDLPPNPNSLLLSDDGNTLFVTVKQKFNKDHSTDSPDKVIRIDLNK